MTEQVAIADVKLSCVVCGSELPARRATSRSKFTCKKECRDTWMAFQKFQRQQRRCNYCHAPATPEERERYRAWRKSEGQIRNRPGRPVSDEVRGRMREHREALVQAIEWMQRMDLQLTGGAEMTETEYESCLDAMLRFQNLVDGKGWVRRTLPESATAGETPKGDKDGILERQAVGTGSGDSGCVESNPDEYPGAADRTIAGDAEPDQRDGDAGAQRECADGAAERGDASGHAVGADLR